MVYKFDPKTKKYRKYTFFGAQLSLQRLSIAFPGGSDGKEAACNARDPGLIPKSWQSPGGGPWQPTPVFLSAESHGQRSLWTRVHGVAKSRTRLKWLGTTLQCLTLGSPFRVYSSDGVNTAICCIDFHVICNHIHITLESLCLIVLFFSFFKI